ncbi:hypothetical protein DACRYDRAFT_115943 [Dacryopinax primogenitus]|uniref:Uncharacterized protein n=1 Tax=Dacryopinax primogenitus (strain DJM 731) TaxID=1858805 RepID=M5G0C1_DACPD|nr:uncharacterized protein DACRYDRAFT_115943 [Dacryopinax primogenitus]EJU02184.1 hypothetical protein DACRYDRAFT_115943 [Dacryopinax primogenitus]
MAHARPLPLALFRQPRRSCYLSPALPAFPRISSTLSRYSTATRTHPSASPANDPKPTQHPYLKPPAVLFPYHRLPRIQTPASLRSPTNPFARRPPGWRGMLGVKRNEKVKSLERHWRGREKSEDKVEGGTEESKKAHRLLLAKHLWASAPLLSLPPPPHAGKSLLTLSQPQLQEYIDHYTRALGPVPPFSLPTTRTAAWPSPAHVTRHALGLAKEWGVKVAHGVDWRCATRRDVGRVFLQVAARRRALKAGDRERKDE